MVTREWDRPDTTCTKYIKTLSEKSGNAAAAFSPSRGDRQRWGEGGGKDKCLKVRGRAPPVCPPASCTGRFPWTSWSPRWWPSYGALARPWGLPLCRWPGGRDGRQIKKTGMMLWFNLSHYESFSIYSDINAVKLVTMAHKDKQAAMASLCFIFSFHLIFSMQNPIRQTGNS